MSQRSIIPIDATPAIYPSFLSLNIQGSLSSFGSLIIKASFLVPQLTKAFTYVFAKFSFAESNESAALFFSSKCYL